MRQRLNEGECSIVHLTPVPGVLFSLICIVVAFDLRINASSLIGLE